MQIVFIIILVVVAAVAGQYKKYQQQQQNQPQNNRQQPPRYGAGNMNSAQRPPAYTPPSGQSTPIYTAPSASAQPVYTPPMQTSAPSRGRTDANNYEQRKYQADEMLRRAGYGNDDAADMVDAVDSYSMNHLGIQDPNRCVDISPDDFNAKKEELRTLLQSGIISKKEHDLILREYRACLSGDHYDF